ncbi:LodA/GoxA family CTQ-dependent oxidase [Aromatoleum anaerobium]|uniref:L-Lysine epsilon oxidase N-terminal domain-containing protein n=1 Tax=Aromatoleum anaerobium TaxID=182180 RepID=A0ABX1PSA0_9RHOO|nr:LodA/GoxA family CTQ-dependent oxidase [Aromatoleum anaerobium]MCK0508221.1 LodA/GoxA family CTQ-dependent oxidase [Aromatoleum anaerobium]
MIDLDKIAFCKIFPPLGIARVGDSVEPEGYFFAPETPDGKPRPASGGSADAEFKYRDGKGAIRRQAALFHIYAFDADGKPLGELLSKQAQIRWTVALANKKAAWFEFDGAQSARSAFEGLENPVNISGDPLVWRNVDVGELCREAKGPHGHRFVADKVRKEQLEIIAPERSVSGASLRHKTGERELQFVGKFQRHHDVYLGEIATDKEGRLIVLGGHGVSAPVDAQGKLMDDPTYAWITHYANNNNWFDDTADGPVKAEVALVDADGKPTKRIEVVGGSWVVVAPPDFAPDSTNVVTLYDVMEEVAHDLPALCNSTTPPVHTVADLDLHRDIWPIIERSAGYRWVSKLGLRGHGQGRPGDGLNGNSTNFDGFKKAMKARDGALREQLTNALRPPVYTRGRRCTARSRDGKGRRCSNDFFHAPAFR